MNKLYTDFDLSFELNENTNDLKDLTDEDIIRTTIKNSVNMNEYDIPFNKWYAANLKYYLFEQPNKIIESEIKKTLTSVLNLDPRLKNPIIDISYSADYRYCYIDITVFVMMLNKDISEKIKFDRVR